jgi:hypothetical protein
MAQAIADSKENMTSELYRVLKVDLVNRTKVNNALVSSSPVWYRTVLRCLLLLVYALVNNSE